MAEPMCLQLDKLYREEWGKIADAIRPYKDIVSIPFLATPERTGGECDEEWWTGAKLRIMVFGQEIGGNYRHSDWSFAHILDNGDVCAEADEVYIDWMYGEDSWRRGFLRNLKCFKDRLPEASFLWNNLDLMGIANKDGSLREKNRAAYDVQAHFSTAVLPKMLEITKPDVVLFFTGKRDDVIIRNFGVEESDFEAFDDVHGADELAWVKNFPVAKVAYRANHPTSRTFPLKNEVKDSIIADIKENFKL